VVVFIWDVKTKPKSCPVRCVLRHFSESLLVIMNLYAKDLYLSGAELLAQPDSAGRSSPAVAESLLAFGSAHVAVWRQV